MPTLTYKSNPLHRNGSRKKSQWTISVVEEEACFFHAYSKGWMSVRCCWGLHFDGGSVDYLGKSAEEEARRFHLFVGKFIDSYKKNEWHGYPSDHVNNVQDIPPGSILSSWYQNGFLRRQVTRKIARGQPCKL